MKITRARALTIALVFTILSAGIHFYLSRQHYGLKYGGLSGPSMCNVSDTFNCDSVAASDFSAVAGIPIALFGMMANLILAFFLMVTRLEWTDDPRNTGRYALWLAILIALASVLMAGVSFIFMSTYCLFCLACYVLSFLSLILIWKGTDHDLSASRDFSALFGAQKWVLILALIIPVGAYLSHISTLRMSGASEMQEYLGEVLQVWKAAPTQSFDSHRGLSLGAPEGSAKFTIVEFADFRCSHCKHAAPTLHSFTKGKTDTRLILKFYPLDGTCNPAPGFQGRGDGISCQLAFITQCEQKLRGKGWEAHDFIFAKQDQIIQMSSAERVLEMYCAERESNCAELRACVTSQETRDEIRAMAQEGVDAHIRGTPAIFGNGKLIPSGQSPIVLDAIHRSF